MHKFYACLEGILRLRSSMIMEQIGSEILWGSQSRGKEAKAQAEDVEL